MTSFDGDGGVPLSNAWWEHPAQLSEASKILQRNVFFLLFFGGGGMLRWRIRIRDNRAELMMVFGKFLLVVCLFFPSFILHPFYRHRRKLGVLYTFVGHLRRRRRRHEMVMMTFGATAAHTCWLGPKWGVWEQERQIHTTVLSQRGLLTCRSWLMCPPLDEDQPYW